MITYPISYIARIPQVSEIILDGAADLPFWLNLLRPKGLEPLEAAGRAGISISVTRLKWMGIPFREVTVSMPVRAVKSGESGGYLLQAYNSSAGLAWMERKFFQTPYLHAAIESQDELPAWARLVREGQAIMDIRMNAAPHLLGREQQLWEGPIFLPEGGGRFYARLDGEISTYAFEGGSCEYHAGSPEAVWRQLAESGFEPLRWRIRPNGEHARSKTIKNGYN